MSSPTSAAMKDYENNVFLLLDGPLTMRGHALFAVPDHDRLSVADFDVSRYTPSSPPPEFEITDHYTPSTPPLDFDITDDHYKPSSQSLEVDITDCYSTSSPLSEFDVPDHYTPDSPQPVLHHYTPSTPRRGFNIRDHYTSITPLPEFDITDHYAPGTPLPEFHGPDHYITPVLSKRQRLALGERDWRRVTKKRAVRSDPCSEQSWLNVRHKTTAMKHRPSTPHQEFDFSDHSARSTPPLKFSGPDHYNAPVLSKRQRLALDERDWRSVTKKHAVRSDPCSGQSWFSGQHKTTVVKCRPSTPHLEFDISDHSTCSTPVPDFNGPDQYTAPVLSKRQRLALDERDWRSVTKKHAVRSDPCSGQAWLSA